MSVEEMEQRLDDVAAEALRREAYRLDLAGASKEERASVMASTRAKVMAWRGRATASALRAAVPTCAGR